MKTQLSIPDIFPRVDFVHIFIFLELRVWPISSTSKWILICLSQSWDLIPAKVFVKENFLREQLEKISSLFKMKIQKEFLSFDDGYHYQALVWYLELWVSQRAKPKNVGPGGRAEIWQQNESLIFL